MDSFEWNKIAGAVLFALLVAVGLRIVSETLFTTEAPEEPGYIIATATEEGEGAGEAAESQPIGVLLASADPGKGEAAAKKCLACHTFGNGEANKVGPNLWGVVMRPIAAHEGYEYSEAMHAFAQEDGNWTYEHLSTYLHDPQGVVPGTKMTFAGLKGDGERANVIAYLRTLSDNPEPLPAAEAAAPATEGEDAAGEAGEQPAAEGEATEGEAAEEPAPADGQAGAQPAAEGQPADAGQTPEPAAPQGGQSEQPSGGEAPAEAEGEQPAPSGPQEQGALGDQPEQPAVASAAEPQQAEQPAGQPSATAAPAAEQPAAAAEAAPAAGQPAESDAQAAGAAAETQTAQAEQPQQPAAGEEQASAAAPAGDPAKGETFARRCAACHTFDAGGANKVGPHLFGVMNRPIASVDGFNYSDAMVEFSDGGSKVWDAATLDSYLADPRGVVPGTKMVFPGVKSEADRQNVIAYLATLHE
jgi:cytochrome c2